MWLHATTETAQNIRGKNQKLGNIIIQSLPTDFKSLSCPKQVQKKEKGKLGELQSPSSPSFSKILQYRKTLNPKYK
jgi:hypothetical protein